VASTDRGKARPTERASPSTTPVISKHGRRPGIVRGRLESTKKSVMTPSQTGKKGTRAIGTQVKVTSKIFNKGPPLSGQKRKSMNKKQRL
jgi:hypothetical protein